MGGGRGEGVPHLFESGHIPEQTSPSAAAPATLESAHQRCLVSLGL